MKYLLIPVLGLFIFLNAEAQEQRVISLEYCMEQLDSYYPAAAKKELQAQITDLNVRLRQSGRYPDLRLSGSASYQSEVVESPFPGGNFPEFSKDNYAVSLELTQSVYDGGRVSSLKELEQASGAAEEAGADLELWEIRSGVEQVFFSILMIRKQTDIVELLLKDLQEQHTVISSRVSNGVVLPSNEWILKAEILKVQQQLVQLRADLDASYKVLSALIGEEIPSESVLVIPGPDFDVKDGSVRMRPEYRVFDSRKQVLEEQMNLVASDRLPVVSAFARSAYGRPGYNAFDNDMHLFWMVGLKAQWNFRDWRNAGNKEQVLRLKQAQLETDEDAFSRQLEASLKQTEARIAGLIEQIHMDEEVMELREAVVEEKESQLTQGVITSTEYLTELNAESIARLSLEMHKLQLVQANHEYLTKRGIKWN